MKQFIIFFLIISNFCFGQISFEKQKLLEPLAKLDYAESSNVGVGGEPSEIYEKFQSIKNKFTNKELLFLARNSSNALRLYSCQELVYRNEPLVVALFYYYKHYPLKMSYTSGCIGNVVDLSEMIKQQFEFIIQKKTLVEEILLSLNKTDEPYKYYEEELKKIRPILNSEFYKSYEKIKEINSNFGKETGSTSNYTFPKD